MKELTRAINDHLAAEFQASHTYLVYSDEEVELPTVEAPERQWPSVQQLFDAAYELEKGVTSSINRLYSIPEQQGERSATAMLDRFVAGQLQEGAEARFVCKRLRLAGDNSAALLLLDQQFLEGTALTHVKGGMSGSGSAGEA